MRRDPELALRLQYQDRIKGAKTQAGQQRLTEELRDKLVEVRAEEARKAAMAEAVR